MRNFTKRVTMLAAVSALAVGALAPSALANHRYHVTNGKGNCVQLGGKSAAGTSDKGLDTAEEKGNGQIEGGACPTS